MKLRRAQERGHASHGWLESWHSFSFAGYHDPQHMGFGPLRVINDDTVAPGQGFGLHGHKDMDIVSYVLSGALEHQDSLGTGSVLRYGDVQRMSAGSGVHHSEFNHSTHDPVHFLQVWIIPPVQGVAPVYEQKHFTPAQKQGQLRLVASPDGAGDSVRLLESVRIYAGLFADGESATHALAPGRLAYVHVATGRLRVSGHDLSAGDALMFENEPGEIVVEGGRGELLLFDLPP